MNLIWIDHFLRVCGSVGVLVGIPRRTCEYPASSGSSSSEKNNKQKTGNHGDLPPFPLPKMFGLVASVAIGSHSTRHFAGCPACTARGVAALLGGAAFVTPSTSSGHLRAAKTVGRLGSPKRFGRILSSHPPCLIRGAPNVGDFGRLFLGFLPFSPRGEVWPHLLQDFHFSLMGLLACRKTDTGAS